MKWGDVSHTCYSLGSSHRSSLHTFGVGHSGPPCVFCWDIKVNIFRWDSLCLCSPTPALWTDLQFHYRCHFFSRHLENVKTWELTSSSFSGLLFESPGPILSIQSIAGICSSLASWLDSEVPDFWIRIRMACLLSALCIHVDLCETQP